MAGFNAAPGGKFVDPADFKQKRDPVFVASGEAPILAVIPPGFITNAFCRVIPLKQKVQTVICVDTLGAHSGTLTGKLSLGVE